MLRGTPQVLGELPGLGRSHIVVLAWSGSMSVVLVVPSTMKKQGWVSQSATTTGCHKSSAGKVTFGYFNFVGLWLIPGMAKPEVGSVHFQLGDGSELDEEVRDGKFLIVRELDPIPFEATVLSRDGKAIDDFRIRPKRAK